MSHLILNLRDPLFNIIKLQPISGSRIWCFASMFPRRVL